MIDDTGSTDAPSALMHLAVGYWISQALFATAKLGVADILAEGPKTAAELADKTAVNSDALNRVLRALATEKVFLETDDGRFALTPLSDHLRSNAQPSILPYVLMFSSDWHWRVWGQFFQTIRTGKPAFDQVFGSSVFEYLAGHDDDAQVFNAAMTSRSNHEDSAVAAAYEWPAAGKIVDVGGGRGSQLVSILDSVSNARGIVFDLPRVIEAAAEMIQKADLTTRCEAGDFFQQVPVGGDVYLLKKVIHNWDDDRSRVILGNCRSAMNQGARVVLVEHVLPGRNEPSWSKWLDLEMLNLHQGGRERSEAEFAALLSSAGLAKSRVFSTPVGVSLIEAVPV
jgi:O-methyltransferase domain/Dimerisation domain